MCIDQLRDATRAMRGPAILGRPASAASLLCGPHTDWFVLTVAVALVTDVSRRTAAKYHSAGIVEAPFTQISYTSCSTAICGLPPVHIRVPPVLSLVARDHSGSWRYTQSVSVLSARVLCPPPWPVPRKIERSKEVRKESIKEKPNQETASDSSSLPFHSRSSHSDTSRRPLVGVRWARVRLLARFPESAVPVFLSGNLGLRPYLCFLPLDLCDRPLQVCQ